MKLTKKSFRERVKKLFATVYKFSGIVTNSILKKFFPDFKVSSSESWANLADQLINMEEKTELEILCEDHWLTANKRSHNVWSIYSGQEFLGEVSINFMGIWHYTFRSNGYGRRARSLNDALVQLMNNWSTAKDFSKKSKEYYDLFAASTCYQQVQGY